MNIWRGIYCHRPVRAAVTMTALCLASAMGAAEQSYWLVSLGDGSLANESASYRASRRDPSVGFGYGVNLGDGYFVEGRASRYDVEWEPTFGTIPPAPLPQDQSVSHTPLNIVVGRRIAIVRGFEVGVSIGGSYTLVEDIPTSNESLSSFDGLVGAFFEYRTTTGLALGMGMERSTFRSDEIYLRVAWGFR